MKVNENFKKWGLPFILIGVILIADQWLKIWVKTHMYIGEEIPLIGNWCILHFIENEGMAFGMKFGGDVGKIILTLFRLIASGAILWLMCHLIKKGKSSKLFIYSWALIFCGAVGNVIDSCFYGLIFNESFYNIAELFPAEGGYAGFGYGRVVDMFYFPLIDTNWPEWMPWIGGKHFSFFNAVFNIADASITIGVILLLIDQLFFDKKKAKKAQFASDVEHKE